MLKKPWYFFPANKLNIYLQSYLHFWLRYWFCFPSLGIILLTHLRGGKKQLKMSSPYFSCLEIILASRRDGEGCSQSPILFHTWSRKALDNSRTVFILAITKVFFFPINKNVTLVVTCGEREVGRGKIGAWD